MYISRVIHGVMQEMGYSEEQIAQYFKMSGDMIVTKTHGKKSVGGINRMVTDAQYFDKKLEKVIDWSTVDKEDYLLAMERSPIKDIEIKYILKQALTDKVDDREVYMKGIDHSYYYEGYAVYKAQDL